MDNQIFYIRPCDTPIELNTDTWCCIFMAGGSLHGRFLFTDWGTLAVADEGISVTNCVFIGNKNSIGLRCN